MKLSRKTIIVAFCLPFLLFSSVTAADANLGAQAKNATPMSFGTGTFAVAPESTSTGTAKVPLVLGTVATTPGSLMYLVNQGSIKSLSQTITPTTPTGGRTITFAYCLISAGSYGVFVATPFNTCSTGTLTTICTVTSTVTTCPAAIPLNPGQNVQVRVRTSRAAGFAVTASVSISSSQIRLPITTIS